MVLAKENDFRGVNRALLMTQPYGIVFVDKRNLSDGPFPVVILQRQQIFSCKESTVIFPARKCQSKFDRNFSSTIINFALERADVKKDYVYALVVFESYSSNHFLSFKVIFHLKKATELYKRPGYRVSYRHRFLLNATV